MMQRNETLSVGSFNETYLKSLICKVDPQTIYQMDSQVVGKVQRADRSLT